MKKQIAIFEGKQIRRHWDDEKEGIEFAILTDEVSQAWADFQRAI